MKLPTTIESARQIQHELRQRVSITPLKKKPGFIAGVDAAFSGDRVIAAACLFKYPELAPIEDTYAVAKIPFPYIPGFLSFREGPPIIKALATFSIKPDLILFDGQGISHPEGMGIATHIGVILNIPTIGCAKSRLVGDYRKPGKTKGEHSKLIYRNKTVGAVLRTRDNVKPLYVSPGHLIDLKGAIKVVITCLGKYRLPEPIRRADALSKKLKKT